MTQDEVMIDSRKAGDSWRAVTYIQRDDSHLGQQCVERPSLNNKIWIFRYNYELNESICKSSAR